MSNPHASAASHNKNKFPAVGKPARSLSFHPFPLKKDFSHTTTSHFQLERFPAVHNRWKFTSFPPQHVWFAPRKFFYLSPDYSSLSHLYLPDPLSFSPLAHPPKFHFRAFIYIYLHIHQTSDLIDSNLRRSDHPIILPFQFPLSISSVFSSSNRPFSALFLSYLPVILPPCYSLRASYIPFCPDPPRLPCCRVDILFLFRFFLFAVCCGYLWSR